MDERGTAARLGAWIVAGLKWVIYCGAVGLVGGGVVFVLLVSWLGMSPDDVLRRTPIFGGVSPSTAAVGVLLAVCVLVLDADLGA